VFSFSIRLSLERESYGAAHLQSLTIEVSAVKRNIYATVSIQPANR